jgi:hypothetical protein
MDIILEINTDKFYTIREAKNALKGVPTPEYGTRNHSIYFYEMWTLVRVLEYLNPDRNDSGKLRFSDGNRNDDGIVLLNDLKQEIQFVLAINGQQENIRMEHKKKYSRAPAVQDMKWSGKKWERTLPEQNTVAFGRSEIMGKLKSLVQIAVQRKIKKQYCGMWLGVVFEDHTPPFSEKTAQDYAEVCDCAIKAHEAPLGEIYKKVFFLGKSGRYIKQFDL